jgi:3-keto-disaccharide hydrolase
LYPTNHPHTIPITPLAVATVRRHKSSAFIKEPPMNRTFRLLFFALIAACLGGLASQAPAGDKDFKDLFNGKDMSGWKVFPEKIASTFTVEEGYIKVSGKPNGYFYTDKSYKNYILKFDWRYKRPDKLEDDSKFGGNSGLLVHITGEHKVWPTSLEVQGQNLNHASFIAIGGKAVGMTENKFDKKTLEKVRNKVGEWNTTEMTIKNGDVNVKVNGTPVSSCKITLVEGPFGFQSEGAELHFKNIKIKLLD